MSEVIEGVLTSFAGDLMAVAGVSMTIGATALLAWLGWRMACKIPNRGVGK